MEREMLFDDCFCFTSRIIPESPRWLISKHRYQEAEDIIRHAARVNKVTIPESDFEFDNADMNSETRLPKSNIFLLFTSWSICSRTLVVLFSWFVASLSFYGLSRNIAYLGVGNIFLNSLLSSLVEYPASIMCLLLLNRVGRKTMLCAFMLLGGTACVITIFTILYVDKNIQWITLILSLMGKLCVSGAFGVVYVYSAEIFPTVVRNSALGLSSSMARVGGMTAPYFAELGHAVGGKAEQAVPLGMFGCLAVASGLLSLTLPETLNRQLPETFQDVQQYSRNTVTTLTQDTEAHFDSDDERQRLL